MATSNKRQRQLARERFERQQQRRTEERARRKRREAVLGAALAAVLVIGGLAFLGAQLSGAGGDAGTDTAASPSPTATPSASASPVGPKPCAYTATAGRPAAKAVPKPTFDAAAARKPYVATLKTNQGSIVIQALSTKAPCASYSFRWLAEKNYFDGTGCHRLAENAGFGVLQCGDPSGSGAGGPGYSFPDENLTGATYPAGTVAMANSGADTNGSQFFLVFKDTQLPPSYTPWGRIAGGLDVVRKIAAGGITGGEAGNGDGAPKTPVTIQDVTIAG